MDNYLIGNETSLFSITNLRVRIWPILAAIGLGLLCIIPGGSQTFT
jgi:uncharacterized protein